MCSCFLEFLGEGKEHCPIICHLLYQLIHTVVKEKQREDRGEIGSFITLSGSAQVSTINYPTFYIVVKLRLWSELVLQSK